MNPVELIRELAEALRLREVEIDPVGMHVGRPNRNTALLTRAQAFLAAQPVVVEVMWKRPDPDGLIFLTGAIETGLMEETPCTVHVVVTPGAR